MAARRNDRLNAFFSERLNKSIAIITFIAQQGGSRPFSRPGQQIRSLTRYRWLVRRSG